MNDYHKLRDLESTPEASDQEVEDGDEEKIQTIEAEVIGYGKLGDEVLSHTVKDSSFSDKTIFSKENDAEKTPTPGDITVVEIEEIREDIVTGKILEITEKTRDTKGEISVDVFQLAGIDPEFLNTNNGSPTDISRKGVEKLREALVSMKRQITSLERQVYNLENGGGE
jgi:hypothetical protein